MGMAVAAGVAGTGVWLASRALRAKPPGETPRWERKNFRGAPVTLTAGPSVAAGIAAGIAAAPGLTPRVRTAGVVTCLAVGAVGLYDDLAGSTASKGLGGHLNALRSGEVTSGAVKVGVIGLTGLVGSALVSETLVDAAIGGAVIAGHANLLNLLDLRPGRANKVAAAHAPLVLRGPGRGVGAATLGAVLVAFPDDLGEQAMLGDCGANAIGAVLGLAMVADERRMARLVHLAIVTGLTLASEKVSFTAVIERTPVLRALDGLGRRP
jgi:UDP-N-acetylmuramyl pentapeptide phosphotransferase/UDP-N-acetylglucosamine-1-phosphate transferase